MSAESFPAVRLSHTDTISSILRRLVTCIRSGNSGAIKRNQQTSWCTQRPKSPASITDIHWTALSRRFCFDVIIIIIYAIRVTSGGRCALHRQRSPTVSHAASAESPESTSTCRIHVLRGLPMTLDANLMRRWISGPKLYQISLCYCPGR